MLFSRIIVLLYFRFKLSTTAHSVCRMIRCIIMIMVRQGRYAFAGSAMTVDVSLIVPMALDAKTRGGALMEFST